LVSSLSLEQKEKIDGIYEEISEATAQLAEKIIDLVETAGFRHPFAQVLAIEGITLHVIEILAGSTFEMVNKWLDDLRGKLE